MGFETLAHQIRTHYESRQFSNDAVAALLSAVAESHQNSNLAFPGTGCDCAVAELIDCFTAINQTAGDVSGIPFPRAIFGFSFGYRQRSHQLKTQENRLPGQNNRALAEAIITPRALIDLPVYNQFEIADSLQDQHDYEPAYATPAEDMGTKKVIEYFVEAIGWWDLGKRNIIVVAHTHHIGRCLELLEDHGLHGHVPQLTSGLPKSYDKYEAQPRVKSERDCIYNDFISMVARFRDKRGHA